MKRHILGPIVGIALALVLAGATVALGVSRSLDPLFFAVLVGGPLLLVLAIMTLVYVLAKPRPAARVFALMWLPPLAALALWPLIEAWRAADRDRFIGSNPSVHELHVNLSGRDVSVATDGAGSQHGDPVLAANERHRVVEMTRYASPAADRKAQGTYAAMYRDGRVRADLTTITRLLGDGDQHSAVRITVPLALSSPYPRLDDLASSIGSPSEATTTQFFHYGDRTEIAPAIRLAGTQTEALEKRSHDLVAIRLVNLDADPIVRLEINGQAVMVGSDRAAMPVVGNDCRATRGFLRAALAGTWQVRWQTAKPPHAWQQTVVQVPAFGTSASADKPSGGNEVYLFAQSDAPWAVQRARVVRLSERERGIRFTPLAIPGSCKGVEDHWDMSRVTILPP